MLVLNASCQGTTYFALVSSAGGSSAHSASPDQVCEPNGTSAFARFSRGSKQERWLTFSTASTSSFALSHLPPSTNSDGETSSDDSNDLDLEDQENRSIREACSLERNIEMISLRMEKIFEVCLRETLGISEVRVVLLFTVEYGFDGCSMAQRDLVDCIEWLERIDGQPDIS